MKTKPTPNQTYLNKTLIPRCQTLFREKGIKGLKFQKYLEYTYEIIRNNTEAELEELLEVVKEHCDDLRAYIVNTYPNSRALAGDTQNSFDTLPKDEIGYIKALYIAKGLNDQNPEDNAKWLKVLQAWAKYCLGKEISIDSAVQTFGEMSPEEINNVISIREDEPPARKKPGPQKHVIDNSWIRDYIKEARAFLKISPNDVGEWNTVLMKLVWRCKKTGVSVSEFLSNIPEESRDKESISGLLERQA